jgi:rhamnosyltransferase
MTLKATVFIPTFNGEAHLRDIFTMLFRQRVDFEYEVLVIDSGSRDKTVEIIEEFKKKHQNLRFLQIPNTEYGHGKTRDEAAHIAKGEIVVYLSHDAVPSHNRWLYEMVRPFEINTKIVGVMGKQIPRPNCFPLLKYEINAVFGNLGPDFGTTIFYKDDFMKDQGTYDAVSFYSDVNSAGRRAYLTGKFPYKHVSYAEDQVLGRDIINGDYYKAYAPRGSVIHSNDLTLREYKHRMFDETLALRKTGFVVNKPSRKAVVKMTVFGVLKDTVRIVRDKEYSFKRKIYWLLLNPLYYIEKWRGVRLAASVSLKDEASFNKYSLEKRRK